MSRTFSLLHLQKAVKENNYTVSSPFAVAKVST